MCLEDLRLAKGFRLGDRTTINDATAAAAVMSANANRVALIVSPDSATPVSRCTLSTVIAKSGAWASMQNSVPTRNAFTIFEYGQLVIMPIFAVFGTFGNVNWIFTEIVADISVPPMTDISQALPGRYR